MRNAYYVMWYFEYSKNGLWVLWPSYKITGWDSESQLNFKMANISLNTSGIHFYKKLYLYFSKIFAYGSKIFLLVHLLYKCFIITNLISFLCLLDGFHVRVRKKNFWQTFMRKINKNLKMTHISNVYPHISKQKCHGSHTITKGYPQKKTPTWIVFNNLKTKLTQ